MSSQEEALLRELERILLESEERREELVCPERFIIEVLGYQLKDFHQEWFQIQQRNKKSLILAPRGHGKSTICTISYSLWSLLNNPDLRILIVSKTSAQACAFLREIRAHLESNLWLQANFGLLAGKPWSENEIVIKIRRKKTKEASITALGVLGPIIARHYDLILLDDVVDEENARSSRQREKILRWYYKVLLPCLEPEGEIHIIGTRYHYLDLYGHLIANDFFKCHWVYRALQENGNETRALWEEKFPLSLLYQLRREAGPAIFNSQYQNDTELMKGAIFQEQWIQYYQDLPSRLEKIIGIDLAISQKEQRDFFALVVLGWDRKSGGFYVLETFRDRLSFQNQVKASVRLFQKHHHPHSPVLRVCVENNGYQEAFAQKLREQGLPVKSVTRVKDKISRAYQLQARFENAEIFFPRQGAEKLIEELLLFPEADHDDLFDAMELSLSQFKILVKPFPKGLPDLGPE